MASPDKYQTAAVTWRKNHSGDLWSVRLRTPEPFEFKPGQYCTLGVQAGEKVIERAYSIASSPGEPELELFVELVPHGELTPLLHAREVGDTVLMRPRAKGLFALDTARRSHLLACTVTGVAPYVSIVRTLVAEAARGKPPALKLLILDAGSRSWELAYREELTAASERYPGWLRYVPTVSRPWEDEGWSGERGRAEDVLRKYLDAERIGPEDGALYLCGHPGMIDNCKGIALRRGFARESMHVEVYWMPKKEKPEQPAG